MAVAGVLIKIKPEKEKSIITELKNEWCGGLRD